MMVNTTPRMVTIPAGNMYFMSLRCWAKPASTGHRAHVAEALGGEDADGDETGDEKSETESEHGCESFQLTVWRLKMEE